VKPALTGDKFANGVVPAAEKRRIFFPERL
jgi:hypothetical protein